MAMPPRRENDASYRNLFNHTSMIEWLLKRFVAQPWIDRLDCRTLEPVKAHFVGTENQHRESDLIWRAKLLESNPKTQAPDGDQEVPAPGTDQWFYVYVLVEFQSTTDRFMALRILGYLCLLYEDLIRQKALTTSGKLPPVLPIVLYNGAQPWRMPVQLAELIEPVSEGLMTYVPRFEYIILDEGHLPKHLLEPLDNPVTAVFQLEQARSLDDLRRIVSELSGLLESPDMEGPRRDMITWLRRVILPVVFPGESFPELHELKETEAMLAERIKQWPKQWLAEGEQRGLAKGRAEGERKGRKDGLRTALELQLELKFGRLPTRRLEQLRIADGDQLLFWTRRLLDAESIDEVFGE